MKKEVIAIDLGGTYFRCAKISRKEIKNFSKFQTPKDKEKIVLLIEEEIKKRISKKTKGIGIALAGTIIDNKIKKTPNLPLSNSKLSEKLKRKFNVPIKIENDANCVALAESEEPGKENIIVLTLGTGIGGGIIINKKLYKGRGEASEFGHMIINKEKEWEDWSGTHKIKKLIKKKFGKEISFREFKKLIDKNNKKSILIENEITNYLGQGIASLISVFDPEEIVLAGGMKNYFSKNFTRKIKNSTKKHSFVQPIPKITWNKVKEPGLVGAGLLLEDG